MSDGQNSLRQAIDAKLKVSLFSVSIALLVLHLTCDRVNFGVWLLNVPIALQGFCLTTLGRLFFNVPVALQRFCFSCPLLT